MINKIEVSRIPDEDILRMVNSNINRTRNNQTRINSTRADTEIMSENNLQNYSRENNNNIRSERTDFIIIDNRNNINKDTIEKNENSENIQLNKAFVIEVKKNNYINNINDINNIDSSSNENLKYKEISNITKNSSEFKNKTIMISSDSNLNPNSIDYFNNENKKLLSVNKKKNRNKEINLKNMHSHKTKKDSYKYNDTHLASIIINCRSLSSNNCGNFTKIDERVRKNNYDERAEAEKNNKFAKIRSNELVKRNGGI